MDDGWDGYVAFTGEDPLLVEFQGTAADRSLREELPALLRIEMEVVAPDSQGQPSDIEARHLEYEEKQLVELLTQHDTGGVLIARATCRGTRELVLALPEPGRADYVLRKWSRKLERECAVESPEGGWSFVDEHLLPGQPERTWMTARDAIMNLLDAGADPEGLAILQVEARPDLTVPLDPFAVASALTDSPPESPWTIRMA